MLLFVSLSVSKRTNLQEQVVSDNDKGSWAGLYTQKRLMSKLDLLHIE